MHKCSAKLSVNTEHFTSQALYSILAQLSPVTDFVIAYSGGLDSHVLLHALATGVSPGQFSYKAVHINHGLHHQAESWADHCRQVCQDLDVPLDIISIDARAAPGESPEASARHARYTALSECVGVNQALLTAHHLDDQVETLMLQLVRGAGLRGLAGMPACQAFAEGYLIRPLLGYSRQTLNAYARHNSLSWIEDFSNADLSYDRNYLRHKVMPLLYERWPGSRQTIARSAGFAAETVAMAELLGQQDTVRLKDVADNALPVAALQSMPDDRRRNLLRVWIREAGLTVPSANILDRISTEVLSAARDRDPLVTWEGGEIRRYRDRIYALSPLPEPTPALRLVWNTEILQLPLGELESYHTTGDGLHPSIITHRTEVRFRQGGESIRPAGRGRQRNVKKLLQEHSIPPWLRDLMPLVYVDDELAAIPGICVAQEWSVDRGESGIGIRWNLPGVLTGLV